MIGIEVGAFDTLIAAAKAAGLDETLKKDTLTVFAPNDDAFAKLPAGTVEQLYFDKDKLTEILTYHVVDGKHMTSELMNMRSIKTLQGGELQIDIKKSMVNDAKVLRADIEASNGVFHMIDSVLMP
ncbi:MAG: fasciclin domain-containing protein [Methanobacteriaceae archaeon]